MSYHRALGGPMPTITPTTAFAQAVDPYTARLSPPGAIYSPYGWGPNFNVGMPFNYTHHIGYERTPVRRGYYDVLSGSWSGGHPGGGDYRSLAGVLAVL